MELEETRAAIEKQGLRIAAISYDSIGILEAFAKRRNIGFPLLSDQGSAVIRAFGVLNESVPKTSGVFGIPHPVTLVVDPQGKVLSKHHQEDYKERETVGSILSHKFNLRTGLVESHVETKHLKLTASASNAVVRPNQHVRLRIDFAMKPRMHVYAPGVVGYKPLSWTLKPAQAFTVRGASFPPPRMLRLEAIKETVPVFEGNFTGMMELVLASTPVITKVLEGKQELTVQGELLYQACDDKICYVPQTIPLTWKLRFEPLDSERAPKELQHNLGR